MAVRKAPSHTPYKVGPIRQLLEQYCHTRSVRFDTAVRTVPPHTSRKVGPMMRLRKCVSMREAAATALGVVRRQKSFGPSR